MAAAAIFDSLKHEIVLANGVQRIKSHEHAKFRQKGSIGCEDIKIFRLFKMAVVRHLGFVWAYLDHPQWVLKGLYNSTKFGYDQCSSFYNMNISIFGAFGWKMPIHTPKIGPPKLGFWGNLIHWMGCNITQSQKRHTIAWVRVIWAVKRENVVSGL